MLEVDSVALAFGSKDILSGCYICCNRGEVVGLLGRNGCGKSSLLKVIFGTLRPQFKHLTLEGKIISRSYLGGTIAYLPQDNFIPRFLRVKDVLSECSHTLVTPEISQKYAELQKMKLANISGGERRFLECLWILSRPAEYFLLDEPFSEIAPYQVEVLQDIIRCLGKTKGIILTDHMYQPLLEISNRIVLLHNHAAYNIREEEDLVLYQYIPQY
ncbi:ATP-binding cassette domain-containing protein [Arcticibacter sp.]|jgi:ABC-type lipopolysaccharide export system ATPase subunit|uniref:ATP-binding cassette domain-containing protein n=1 Tax=Arcticibacter sp. TaxID=1872630 RepID=UPI00388D4B67